MAAPTFQALVGDLRTGKIATRLPLTGVSWQQVLNNAGTITGATVNVADAGGATTVLTYPDTFKDIWVDRFTPTASTVTFSPNLDLYHTAAPGKAFLAIAYDQTILAGGPIWTHHYSRSAGILTMGAAGLWSLFDHRKILPLLTQPVVSPAAQNATTTYATGANMSLGDIAAALVAQAQTHVGGNLPLVMPPAQGMTPGATRTVNGFDLRWVGTKLTELAGVINGPEIRFRPRFKASDPTSIEWLMEVGSPAQPLLVQGGADWIFDASVPKSMVSDYETDIDATGMGTRVWEIGSGSGSGVMLSQADSTQLTTAGYPLLEVEDQHTSVLDQATLDGYASQRLGQVNRPAALWKVKVRNDGGSDGVGGPKLGQYLAGDYCQVVIGADPYLAPGIRRCRILQVDGDYGWESVLTLATMSAEV